MLKWLVITIGIIVGVALLLGVLTILLPQRHRVKRSALLHGSPDEVWAIINDPFAQPHWHPEITEVEPVESTKGQNDRHWREVHRSGEVNIVQERESVPLKRLVLRFEEEHGAFRAEWNISLEPAPGGTRMTIRQQSDLRRPLARLVGIFIGRDSSLKLYLGALESHLRERA